MPTGFGNSFIHYLRVWCQRAVYLWGYNPPVYVPRVIQPRLSLYVIVMVSFEKTIHFKSMPIVLEIAVVGFLAAQL